MVLVMALTPGRATGQEAGAPGAPPPATGAPPSRVTLVTGDRVTLMTVDGRAVTHVEPGEGREGIRFSTYQAGDHVYVIPSDAAARNTRAARVPGPPGSARR